MDGILEDLDNHLEEVFEELERTIQIERVSYGKKGIPKELREYKLLNSDMFSPVGTIKEWELMYPTKKIVIVGDEDE